jgi:hypothetical protein
MGSKEAKTHNAIHFFDDLLLATVGDEDALLTLFKRCEPLINKFSMNNGCFDEDLKQTLVVEWFRAVKAFDPSRHFTEDEEEAGQP